MLWACWDILFFTYQFQISSVNISYSLWTLQSAVNRKASLYFERIQSSNLCVPLLMKLNGSGQSLVLNITMKLKHQVILTNIYIYFKVKVVFMFLLYSLNLWIAVQTGSFISTSELNCYRKRFCFYLDLFQLGSLESLSFLLLLQTPYYNAKDLVKCNGLVGLLLRIWA